MSTRRQRRALVAWVKMGDVWWPGKLLKEEEYTRHIKWQVECRINQGIHKDRIKVVEFFLMGLGGYEICHRPAEILVDICDSTIDRLIVAGCAAISSSPTWDYFRARKWYAAAMEKMDKFIDGSKYYPTWVARRKAAAARATARKERQAILGTAPPLSASSAIKPPLGKPAIAAVGIPEPSCPPPLTVLICPNCPFSVSGWTKFEIHRRNCKGTYNFQQPEKVLHAHE